MPENNSDSYPIVCTLSLCLDRSEKKENRAVNSKKVNWKKVDLEAYRCNLVKHLNNVEVTMASASGVDNGVIKFSNILQRAVSIARP